MFRETAAELPDVRRPPHPDHARRLLRPAQETAEAGADHRGNRPAPVPLQRHRRCRYQQGAVHDRARGAQHAPPAIRPSAREPQSGADQPCLRPRMGRLALGDAGVVEPTGGSPPAVLGAGGPCGCLTHVAGRRRRPAGLAATCRMGVPSRALPGTAAPPWRTRAGRPRWVPAPCLVARRRRPVVPPCRQRRPNMQIGVIGLGRMGAQHVAAPDARRGIPAWCWTPTRTRSQGLGKDGATADAARWPRWSANWAAARGLGDAAGRQDHRGRRSPSSAGCSGPATSSSTAATPTTRTTSAARRRWRRRASATSTSAPPAASGGWSAAIA